MESITSLIPESSTRSVEDRLLIAKVMRHVADYLKAVKDYGPGFFSMRIDKDCDSDGYGVSLAKLKRDRMIERTKTLAYGKIAYQYLFMESESDIAFLPTCESLGFNATIFRRKLKGISKKEANRLYGFFLRGERKTKHAKENGYKCA